MKGVYVLILKLKENTKMKIGKLGVINFPKGYYCYIGSALGRSVNLENRIKRYKNLNSKKKGNLKWHIDYFIVNPKTSIVETILMEIDKKIECKLSNTIKKIAVSTIKNFGSSDCKCEGHFHYMGKKLNLEKIYEEVMSI